jgi:hypothetical protein
MDLRLNRRELLWLEAQQWWCGVNCGTNRGGARQKVLRCIELERRLRKSNKSYSIDMKFIAELSEIVKNKVTNHLPCITRFSIISYHSPFSAQ